MTTRNLERLFRPQSVAVFGASNQPKSIGEAIMRNLLDSRFSGPIMPVNPRYKAVAGVLAYPDVESLPEAPDLAIIGTPPATVPGLIDSLGTRGTRAAVVLTSGLDRERDASGTLLEQAMLDVARPYLLRILGPNSVGIMVAGIGLNASYVHAAPPPGNLAFVTESGGLATSVLDYAASSGIGFSHVVSVGNSADVDFGDVLDVLGSDPETAAVLLYMESMRNARKFLSAARAAARRKPVLVVKAGRVGDADHTASFHAGTLAGPDAVFDAAMRRAGILRVDTIPALFDAVETLARTRPLAGEHLTIVTNGSSPGLMAVDALLSAGGRLATLADVTIDRLAEVLSDSWPRRNPIDMDEDAPIERQVATLEIVLEDPETDAVLFIHEPVAIVDSEEVASALVDVMRRGRRDVLACWLGRRSVAKARRVFADAGIATYDSPEHAVRAFLQMVSYRKSQQLLMQTPMSVSEAFVPDVEKARGIVEGALAKGRRMLSESEAVAVLAAYGVPVVETAIADTPADALRHAGAHELYVGATVDPVFGPVIVFGNGGAAVDVIQDVAVALPPLNTTLAAHLVSRTRVSRLLAGHRGQPSADLAAVHLALVQIGQLVADIPQIAEVDVNPLVADAAGVAVVDVRVRIEPSEIAGPERLAIRPYPRDLEESITFLGRSVTVRPIRPEDARQHREFFDRLSPEDVRYRFFTLLRQLAQSEMARFTLIDYDREMAFIASAKDEAGNPETLGVVRAVTDPDRLRAEFAIVVRSDLKGRGLGRILLEKMIRYCRRSGIRELVSEVLPENRGMRGLARRVGFDEGEATEDGTVTLHLDLRATTAA